MKLLRLPGLFLAIAFVSVMWLAPHREGSDQPVNRATRPVNPAPLLVTSEGLSSNRAPLKCHGLLQRVAQYWSGFRKSWLVSNHFEQQRSILADREPPHNRPPPSLS
jgi:hypothetical protein